MSQQALWVRGALLLAVAGFISKVLGMSYRVPLQNIAGDEGLYIYQQIYPILSIAIILSVYSIPGALSHAITNRKTKDQVIRLPNTWAVFYLLFSLGTLVFLTLWLLAGPLAQLMGDPSLKSPIRAASLMYLVIPITALFRGYFQSINITEFVALSQVVEQFVRVVGIIVATILTVYYLPSSLYTIGVLTSVASVAGVTFASLLLIILFKRNKSTLQVAQNKSLSNQFIKVLLLGIVIYSINYILHLLLQVVDVFSMIDLLKQYGYTFEESKVVKGVFDRSHSMIQLGLVLGSSLALALIPVLNRDKKQQISAYKWTFLLSLSASVGLMAIMPSLNPLLFMTNEGILSIQLMMGLVFLLSMTVVVSVFLQEYGYRIQQLKWVMLMFVAKWLLNFMLIPRLGEVGSSLAYLVAVSVLLLIFLVKWKRLAQIKIPIFFSVKSIVLTMIMFGVVVLISTYFHPSTDSRWLLIPSVLIQCIVGVVIILAGTYMTKLFTKEEWIAVVGKRFERR
ncbi:oligosaccharide flippase family protein [Piscibacillus sp. B03]|uniref:oligosaccharide flippase family protein n=1 Tax=Piscibacillus sp. B03 TaxID=3457430 RepID=UPI003FCD9B70